MSRSTGPIAPVSGRCGGLRVGGCGPLADDCEALPGEEDDAMLCLLGACDRWHCTAEMGTRAKGNRTGSSERPWGAWWRGRRGELPCEGAAGAPGGGGKAGM